MNAVVRTTVSKNVLTSLGPIRVLATWDIDSSTTRYHAQVQRPQFLDFLGWTDISTRKKINTLYVACTNSQRTDHLIAVTVHQ